MSSPLVASTRLSLVRHAHAGDRSRYVGNDALRPLSEKGKWQAVEIGKSLARRAPLHIVSSPAVRCVATLSPLAKRCGGVVDELEVLAEGSDPKAAMAGLIDLAEAGPVSIVACSHGDVIGGVVELLADVSTPEFGLRSVKKASIVELHIVEGSITAMYFLPPPIRNR